MGCLLSKFSKPVNFVITETVDINKSICCWWLRIGYILFAITKEWYFGYFGCFLDVGENGVERDSVNFFVDGMFTSLRKDSFACESKMLSRQKRRLEFKKSLNWSFITSLQNVLNSTRVCFGFGQAAIYNKQKETADITSHDPLPWIPFSHHKRTARYRENDGAFHEGVGPVSRLFEDLSVDVSLLSERLRRNWAVFDNWSRKGEDPSLRLFLPRSEWRPWE